MVKPYVKNTGIKVNIDNIKSASVAALIAFGLIPDVYAQETDFNESEVAVATPQQGIAYHETMLDSPAEYATKTYLAFVRSPDERYNTISERGLRTLAQHINKQSALIVDGVVGIDLETDDISLFQFIYFPIYNNTPLLSANAQSKIQDYASRNIGMFSIDLVEGTSRTSVRFMQIIEKLPIRPVMPVETGHVLTQSFYLLDGIRGTSNRDVWVETPPEGGGDAHMTGFIIGNENWASAWAAGAVGLEASAITGAAITQDAMRSGVNMVIAAYTGNAKLDPHHEETILMKRENQEKAKLRALREKASSLNPN